MKQKHENEEMKFIMERLYCAQEIPIRMYDANGDIVMEIGIENADSDPFASDKTLLEKIHKVSRGKPYPVLELEEPGIVYGGFCDRQDYFYVMGPVVVERLSAIDLQRYRRKHGIKNAESSIPGKSYIKLSNILAVLFWKVTGEMVSESTILLPYEKQRQRHIVTEAELNKYQFEKAEDETEHISYQYEKNYMSAIENGDVEFFTSALSKQPNVMNKIGKFSEDNKKQIEYMCVSSIVLVSRAAINGGVNPSKAYALSELYLQKLAKCKNDQEILELHYVMRMEYVTLVKEVKAQQRNADYIEQCKDYISRSVHYPIRIKDIADNLKINHSHLSRRFSECEGMTIVQYRIKVRLKAAANMLIYSAASIAEISDYLCFTSQSRFGSQFKKEFGMTPNEYRKENRVIDFLTEGEK